MLKLLQLFHDHDDPFAELAPQQRHANESRVLVAVADDQSLRIALQRKPGDKLRLAAYLEAEMKWFASVEDFFDHFAQLVDLDRKNAAIVVFIVELGDRA